MACYVSYIILYAAFDLSFYSAQTELRSGLESGSMASTRGRRPFCYLKTLSVQ
jgi:hypothetical protein